MLLTGVLYAICSIYTVYIMYAPKVHISGEALRCCEPSLANQEI